MNLADMTLTNFTNLLSSEAPAPGGGSAAALEGALGIALTKMVASLTIGKSKYQEQQQLMEEIILEAETIMRDYIKIIDLDTEAFNGVSAVFSMPKGNDEEKAARTIAMQTALKECTKTPYAMMTYALAALRLTQRAVGKSNISAASDLGVAALSLKAAVQGAWLNILINIGGIKDVDFAKQYKEGGEAILAEALPLADDIYETVKKNI